MLVATLVRTDPSGADIVSVGVGSPPQISATRFAMIELARDPSGTVPIPCGDRFVRGGHRGLSELVGSLPSDFAAAVVIAQHLDPGQPSHLQAILARRTSLPVRVVTDLSPLRPGEISVVPSNQDVVITDHTVALRPAAARSTPSVDRLFRSAADAFGERLVAVVLTGTGSDGAMGARVVHDAGGTVVIQNPETAAFPGMPRALSPTIVDVVADLADIGPLLQQLVSGTYSPAQSSDEEELRALLEGLRQRRGLDFSSYRRPRSFGGCTDEWLPWARTPSATTTGTCAFIQTRKIASSAAC